MNCSHYLCLLLSCILFLYAPGSFGQETDHVRGDLLVMLKNGADVNDVVNEVASLHSEVAGLSAIEKLSQRLNIWQFHFNADAVDEGEMLRAIRSLPDVLVAQFNHLGAELRNTPNDPLFNQQWNMQNISTGADVRATLAWDITTGGLTATGDTIVVAIDDAGFDLNHEDLYYWKNYHEVPGNGQDDDANGYVDDYDGWNAISNNGVITSDPHGTEVAGLAGAKGNNSLGMAGVNWNLQIMPVKGFSGTESIVVIGYTYIMEMRALYNETNGAKGAFIVAANSSFGIDKKDPADYPLWCAMYDSMGKYGILNTAATANGTWDVDVVGDIPTACASNYLVSVTNTTSTDNIYSSAAYGDSTIDLGAPGTSLLSAYPGNNYASSLTGTSFASPHVAGAIALLYSLPCLQLANDFKNDPAGAASHIKSFILSGVDSIPDLMGKTVSGGRLNCYKAMQKAGAYYNCNVGIEEATIVSENISLYPNPARNVLNAVIKNSSVDELLEVKNILGQTVVLKNIPAQAHNLAVNISELPSGVYFLVIGNEVRNSVVRWVKQ